MNNLIAYDYYSNAIDGNPFSGSSQRPYSNSAQSARKATKVSAPQNDHTHQYRLQNLFSSPSPQSELVILQLQDLPFEIRQEISNELSQFDSLNLMLASKALYESTVNRLYQYIIIDHDFSQFSKEYSFKFYKRDQIGKMVPFSGSYVKSVYNVQRLLEMSSHRKMLCLGNVRKIKCTNMPDGLNTFSRNFHALSDQFFKQLTGLNELIWLSDNLRVQSLCLLPNKHLVTVLVLNIISYQKDSIAAFKDLNFPNLINFQITPFENSTTLAKIINRILIPSETPKSLIESLQTMKLSKYNRDSINEPNSESLVSSENNLDRNDINISGALFNGWFRINQLHLDNLKNLALSYCLISPMEAPLFRSSISLSELDCLELENVSEYQRISHEEVGFIEDANMRDYLKPSFLLEILPDLSNLSKLCIDYREALVDSVPKFLRKLPSQLSELELTIRYNSTKTASYPEWDVLSEEYIDSILSHKKTLRKLSIEVKVENYFYDSRKAIDPSQISKLCCLSKLESLRLNGENLHSVLRELVSNLTQLRYLDVLGSHTGFGPHMGLQVVHAGIFDDWFRLQHVVHDLLQFNNALLYIKVGDRCIFEISDTKEIIPRDGISLWFKEKVRVGSRFQQE